MRALLLMVLAAALPAQAAYFRHPAIRVLEQKLREKPVVEPVTPKYRR